MVQYVIVGFLAWIVAITFRAFYLADETEICLYGKSLKHSFFRLGLSFTKESYIDRDVETLALGLFFAGIELKFIRRVDNKEMMKQMYGEFIAAQSDDSDVQSGT